MIYRWLNQDKARYFTITIKKDDSTTILLNYDWGSCNTNRGGKKDVSVQSEEEAKTMINKMMKRRKSRGYELIAPNSF